MMAYKSPISFTVIDQMAKSLAEEFDNEVFRSISKVGIDVDRDELIKALAYDRDQYEKGFNDGRMYKPPVQTNADRIRMMTDEELANILTTINHSVKYMHEKWLDWLKQEAE